VSEAAATAFRAPDLGTRRRHWLDWGFQVLALSVLVVALGALAVLVIDVTMDGGARLNWQFLTSLASRRAGTAGIYHALAGSIFVIALTALLALPVGVAAAIYLEEYGGRSRVARLIEINITNLAALPVVILSTREALRTVPGSIREGSYALGATKWQTIWHQVLPMALPGILTGLILSLSRAIGETAPLITIGALTYVPFAPDGIWSAFTVLPIQIFNWTSRPQPDFQVNAAAGIIVLLVLLLIMNSVAIVVRDRYQRRVRS
jgi:phosphate transport system permease protein